MTKALSIGLVIFFSSPLVLAEEALIAVAANFNKVAEQLAATFEQNSAHEITITSGATGSLYAQILNGAPFDAFLAADQKRPMLLLQSSNAVPGSRFTFASGRLALWSAEPGQIRSDLAATLGQTGLVTLAIANPALAPYGNASREALQSLGVWDIVRDKIVMGENVGQTNALIATGNAQIGIVSLSLVLDSGSSPIHTYLPIPAEMHRPIRQDAILLRHGADNPAARGFLAFIRSAGGQATIESNGYGVD